MPATDGRQLRAARALLGLTIDEAAMMARIHRNSVLRAEKFQALPWQSWAAEKLSQAFERRGVVCDGSGEEICVRLRSGSMEANHV